MTQTSSTTSTTTVPDNYQDDQLPQDQSGSTEESVTTDDGDSNAEILREIEEGAQTVTEDPVDYDAMMDDDGLAYLDPDEDGADLEEKVREFDEMLEGDLDENDPKYQRLRKANELNAQRMAARQAQLTEQAKTPAEMVVVEETIDAEVTEQATAEAEEKGLEGKEKEAYIQKRVLQMRQQMARQGTSKSVLAKLTQFAQDAEGEVKEKLQKFYSRYLNLKSELLKKQQFQLNPKDALSKFNELAKKAFAGKKQGPVTDAEKEKYKKDFKKQKGSPVNSEDSDYDGALVRLKKKGNAWRRATTGEGKTKESIKKGQEAARKALEKTKQQGEAKAKDSNEGPEASKEQVTLQGSLEKVKKTVEEMQNNPAFMARLAAMGKGAKDLDKAVRDTAARMQAGAEAVAGYAEAKFDDVVTSVRERLSDDDGEGKGDARYDILALANSVLKGTTSQAARSVVARTSGTAENTQGATANQSTTAVIDSEDQPEQTQEEKQLSFGRLVETATSIVFHPDLAPGMDLADSTMASTFGQHWTNTKNTAKRIQSIGLGNGWSPF